MLRSGPSCRCPSLNAPGVVIGAAVPVPVPVPVPEAAFPNDVAETAVALAAPRDGALAPSLLRARRATPELACARGPSGKKHSVRCALQVRQDSELASVWHRDLRRRHGTQAGRRWER